MTLSDTALSLPDLPAGQAGKPAEIRFFLYLKQLVVSGHWQGDDILPSPEELARLAGLPLPTVQVAFNLLAQECWIVRREWGGYQITPKINQPISRASGFSELIRERGFTPNSVWLRRELAEPSREEQWRLDLDEGERVARLERIRLANDIAIGYECSSIPASLLPYPEQVEHSLYDWMQKHQLVIVRASEEVGAETCNPAMAIQCGLTSGQAMLRLTRISYLADGRPVELTHSYFRSDYYHYQVELAG
ncbi:GntR family transcriptional regulator [Chitinilyticum piscinae]|uniref:GntR family transcriptional regulator n=1 Tax=Chitinilyticum piscinae TaxID=2866724 RepID=A0A8J7G168_9NEIS|nr:GntR family transcriptional regulator [Chitinilyticum piscinae]MBE9610085.1 GntR family transcriptional regulator [Chitinilyticum piscinae]